MDLVVIVSLEMQICTRILGQGLLFLESRGYGVGVLAAYGGAYLVHGLLRSSWKDWIWIDTCLLSSLWSLMNLCHITGSEYPILLFPRAYPPCL
jgi:hypothetical protein